MPTMTDAKRNGPVNLEDSPSGFGRLIGKLGGLLAGRKSSPDPPDLDPAPIEPAASPVVVDLAAEARRMVIKKSRPAAMSQSGLRRSLESSRELLEPVVDVFEESDCLLVAAILPGVDPALAQVELIDDLLVISTAAPSPVHRKEVPLPAVFDRECMTRSSRDGVLEVRLDLNRARTIRPGSWCGD